MHELSIVMSIIEIAEKLAKEKNVSVVEEIEIDMGELCTVEMESFNFAWQQAVKGTILQDAARRVNRINGLAVCGNCSHVFPIAQYYEPCPACGSHLTDIKQGKELRVKSLIVN